ncbi:lysosomal protective protein-like isoform X2 [Myxocyprinus asiaticus]|uniref:lysosomal protective protein-like isoform X2 n=1 Tax=Myxocyprinus asiaticus TaxID=70543 RepID=UPI0022229803|nr:lysosomal protective protein-like isoform X2 [Myxocyprinus asiaticus]
MTDCGRETQKPQVIRTYRSTTFVHVHQTFIKMFSQRILFYLFVICVHVACGMYDPDEVLDLPGMSFKPNYRQWSGYLKASPGKFLHYWFVTSQRDPLKDPVVLWLNGGPGCSSLDGFLSENGPFHVNDDGATLYENEFSWNKIANILYLESPAGVGFSYSDDQKYETNDDEGFAVGNGISSFALNDQSLIYFGYYHGLFGEQLWKDLNDNCCQNGVCNFYNNSKESCSVWVLNAFHIVYNSGLNEYALYLDCAGGIGSQKTYRNAMVHLFRNFRKDWEANHLVGRTPSVNSVPPCINSTAQMNWLNRGDVRKALHIPDVLPPWDICSDVVGSQYHTIYQTVKDVYEKLLALGLRALVYNGDTDMACNFLGDQWFVEQLGQKATTEYQRWLYDNQIAGFYQQFGNITFLTVKGAGHMVPQWAPGPSLHMLQSFLSNKPY